MSNHLCDALYDAETYDLVFGEAALEQEAEEPGHETRGGGVFVYFLFIFAAAVVRLLSRLALGSLQLPIFLRCCIRSVSVRINPHKKNPLSHFRLRSRELRAATSPAQQHRGYPTRLQFPGTICVNWSSWKYPPAFTIEPPPAHSTSAHCGDANSIWHKTCYRTFLIDELRVSAHELDDPVHDASSFLDR